MKRILVALTAILGISILPSCSDDRASTASTDAALLSSISDLRALMFGSSPLCEKLTELKNAKQT